MASSRSDDLIVQALAAKEHQERRDFFCVLCVLCGKNFASSTTIVEQFCDIQK